MDPRTVRTTIDGAGRVVIPKPIREEAGLAAGVEVDVRIRDGRVEIEPAGVPMRLDESAPHPSSSAYAGDRSRPDPGEAPRGHASDAHVADYRVNKQIVHDDRPIILL